MNKLSKLAFIAATAVMAASASAQSVPASRQAVNDNWVNGTGEYVWMNGTNELCWRDAFWTPATANAKCDGALVAQAPTPPAPVAPPPPVIQSQKVTYQADALFDFDKAVLKPAGKQQLDDLASKIGALNLEVVVATGYTDRIGSDAYNNRLSLRRAQAVKAYLVSKGIESNRIYTEGKGKRDPVTGGKCQQKNRKQLIACLAPDRRVEVEVVGTTRQPQQ
ncbi:MULTISPECIES: outer membrane protein OmpA [unclassified Caballeronia]|uniref:outer membrane protein OmpA n=1 Tax=unclassified Caballeronia TaxID=2646786 RepID=UPI00285B8B8A|nr:MULTISPECIES: OmpA family protein [unclassified Caballeronia]MDR5814229.1 OmpA family protein [Caballeronia sp. LZ033]MDR5820706.1 OmpA family protein [Caballeronia sp. LZ043]MDR5834563.1 OmpA family protein [Caballeronia sp. LZ034LL]MDR5878776.1 OmpA family protein [Caballeronia sp. LZ032]